MGTTQNCAAAPLVTSWPFAGHGGASQFEISATTPLPPRGVSTHIKLFYGTTQDCATATLLYVHQKMGLVIALLPTRTTQNCVTALLFMLIAQNCVTALLFMLIARIV